jgi:hypothetical protein
MGWGGLGTGGVAKAEGCWQLADGGRGYCLAILAWWFKGCAAGVFLGGYGMCAQLQDSAAGPVAGVLPEWMEVGLALQQGVHAWFCGYGVDCCLVAVDQIAKPGRC